MEIIFQRPNVKLPLPAKIGSQGEIGGVWFLSFLFSFAGQPQKSELLFWYQRSILSRRKKQKENESVRGGREICDVSVLGREIVSRRFCRVTKRETWTDSSHGGFKLTFNAGPKATFFLIFYFAEESFLFFSASSFSLWSLFAAGGGS